MKNEQQQEQQQERTPKDLFKLWSSHTPGWLDQAALGTKDLVLLIIGILVVVILLVFLSGPKGGSSISEDYDVVQDYDVALSAGAVKQKKPDHFINNGLLKVYRKVMRPVLNHYQKDVKDFENHPMLGKMEKLLYDNAITDNTILQIITDRGATAKAKSSEGDQNSRDFSRLFAPLVTASEKYVIQLVGYSMEYDAPGPETEFPELRHAVTLAATALKNEGAYYDADAYNRWKAVEVKTKKGKNEIDKMGKDIEKSKKAVKAMLDDIVNQLPKFAHVVARVVQPKLDLYGFLCKPLCALVTILDHICQGLHVSPQTMSALATPTLYTR